MLRISIWIWGESPYGQSGTSCLRRGHPFEIKAARWELYREDWEKGEVVLEAEGECTVSGHTLDALIQPEMAAKYRFKYIYEVADEIWWTRSGLG